MKKIIILVLSIVLIGGAYLFTRIPNDTPVETEQPEMKIENTGPQNTAYTIDGQTYMLFRGYAERETVPGSASKSTISVFGQPSYGDIDGDGDDDAVVILVNDTGGSGVFYYVALAVNIDAEYFGTDTMLLGDRIAPQTYSIEKNRAIVNYTDRAPDEPLSAEPSEGKSLYLQYDPDTLKLIEAVVNPDDEATANRQLLIQKKWTWVKTSYSNDTELTPHNPEAFTLTFTEEGSFSATTDCNEIGGQYTIVDTMISFESMMSTEMFCENSQEQIFSSMLSEIESFTFSEEGFLQFSLKNEKGVSLFQ
jgi:heat shock protein HslJ